jgi:mRNA-degrading endonuclease toxin of MazEF toxin-antitoxin module
MVDKIVTVNRDKIRRVLGQVDAGTMLRVNRSLIVWLGLAG